MTDQELREKAAKTAYKLFYPSSAWEETNLRGLFFEIADQILALLDRQCYNCKYGKDKKMSCMPKEQATQ